MFILYAVAAGIVAGYLLGGRLDRLASIRLRWPWLAVAGLAVQLVLFAPVVADRVGSLGTPLYLGSTAAVLLFVVRNVRVPGLAVIALGALTNLVAILANGGTMPASPAALSVAGRATGSGFSNSTEMEAPALAPLTDVLALPAGLPLANVFSIGDVLIGAGIAIAIAWGMRRPDASTSTKVP